MKADGDKPLIAPSARGLGVRVGSYADVHPDIAGNVHPGSGGMSVAPDDPLGLDTHRRPPEFGGTGRDPVWQLASESLPVALSFRRESPDHGLVEPAASTSLSDFQDDLAHTQDGWTLAP